MVQDEDPVVSIKNVLKFKSGREVAQEVPVTPLRDGENPHQSGYASTDDGSYRIAYDGRGMGFTNHLDLIGYALAFELGKTMEYLSDPRRKAVVINKHTNPTCSAVDLNQPEALKFSMKYDSKSPFGGVLCTNTPLEAETANYLKGLRVKNGFTLDVLASPGFEDGTVELLTQEGSKKEKMFNMRVMDVSSLDTIDKIYKGLGGYNITYGIGGKVIITKMDSTSFFNTPHKMEVISKREPSYQEKIDTHLAWLLAKYTKSNSFDFIRNSVLIGQCGGQTNREDSAKFTKERVKDFGYDLVGTMGATDSFIFDSKTIDMLHEFSVGGVVQPTRKDLTTGSGKEDEEILRKIDEYNMVAIMPRLGANGEKPWRVFRHV